MHAITSKSGKSITLRPPTMRDTQAMLDYITDIADEDIYVNANPADPYTLNDEKRFVESVIKKIETKQQVYVLAWDHDILIGSVSIETGSRRSKHKGTFGITLSNGYRSDGIGQQMAKYAIDQAKRVLNIRIITLTAFARNTPAIHMYQKLGFKQYGSLPGGYMYKQGYEDEVLMYKNLSIS